MSAKECAVCAWRATCKMKFAAESSELHCREYTRDVNMPEVERPAPEEGKADKGKDGGKMAE